MSTQHTRDLAISAVSYDSLVVAELVALAASRLADIPSWDDGASEESGLPGAALGEGGSRVAVVLWQRLWGSDELTMAEAAVLRGRVLGGERAVVVVSLDEAEMPNWMAPLQHRSLATTGMDAVVDFVLDAIAQAGGNVLPKILPDTDKARSLASIWSEAPAPFLGQTRAHGALRRELDSLSASLQGRLDQRRADQGDDVWELHKRPDRVLARFGDAGISFSWVSGRGGAVADGRLMIIEWSGTSGGRGLGAFQGASPARECVYRAEASGPGEWCWRVDRPNGKASSTVNLAGEWVAGVIAARALERGDAA